MLTDVNRNKMTIQTDERTIKRHNLFNLSDPSSLSKKHKRDPPIVKL